MLQRKAVRFICGKCKRNDPHNKLMHDNDIPTFQMRRKYTRILQFHNMLRRLTTWTTRHTHDRALKPLFAKQMHLNSFSHRLFPTETPFLKLFLVEHHQWYTRNTTSIWPIPGPLRMFIAVSGQMHTELFFKRSLYRLTSVGAVEGMTTKKNVSLVQLKENGGKG